MAVHVSFNSLPKLLQTDYPSFLELYQALGSPLPEVEAGHTLLTCRATRLAAKTEKSP